MNVSVRLIQPLQWILTIEHYALRILLNNGLQNVVLPWQRRHDNNGRMIARNETFIKAKSGASDRKRIQLNAGKTPNIVRNDRLRLKSNGPMEVPYEHGFLIKRSA